MSTCQPAGWGGRRLGQDRPGESHIPGCATEPFSVASACSPLPRINSPTVQRGESCHFTHRWLQLHCPLHVLVMLTSL